MEQVLTRRVDAWKYDCMVWCSYVCKYPADVYILWAWSWHKDANHCGNGLVQHNMPHTSLANKVTNSASIKTVLQDEKT